MPVRLRFFAALIAVFLCALAFGKQKNERKAATLPGFVVDAHTVAVVIFPDTSNPVTNPNANRNAQSDVEQALMKWGRLRPAVDAQTADLVIAIQKGNPNGVSPTVRGGGINDRPVVLQPTDGGIQIGAQRGRPPDLTRDQTIPTPDKPQLGTSLGSSDDVFEVYKGNQRYPLDSPPIWRFHGKNGLNSPNVPAVAAFRKALEDALKQLKTQPPAKP